MIIDAPKDAQIPALRALWKEAFGDEDAYLDDFFTVAYAPDRARCITIDAVPVAALYWFDCTYQGKKLAYLYAVATARAQRGKGLCRALMEDTHRHLSEHGYEGVLLSPASDSLFDFYGAMGYQTATYRSEFSCRSCPPREDLKLYRLDVDTYAAKRRAYLPTGGVLQDKVSIAFLATQNELYEVGGTLLALRREGQELTCHELLGDVSRAPEIAAALGCFHGSFRTVGTDKPFTMYYPLGSAPAPTYFGLAFD